MADATENHSAGEPEKESLGRVLGDATALQRIFSNDPALVKLIIGNPGFLDTLFAQPSALRAFLQTEPSQDALDQLLSGKPLDLGDDGVVLGGDGAALAAPRRPEEGRLAALLRDPHAAAFFRRQPELTETLLRNPTFAERVKVRCPRLYQALLDKAQERFGNDPEMAALIASERAGIIDFEADGKVLETPERRARRENGMALLEAMEKGDTGLARLLIEKGADLNARDNHQQTPLHWAAKKGHTDTVRLLIENGVDLDAKDNYQWTPLHLAAMKGHTDIARLLIEKLIEQGKAAEVNAKDNYQRTPLHWAAMKGHTDIARLLIENGVDLDAKDNYQWTPLHWAAWNGHTDLARLLIGKGADLNARDDRQKTPLHRAAMKGHTDLVNLLQAAAKDSPGYAGHIAKRRGNERQLGG